MNLIVRQSASPAMFGRTGEHKDPVAVLDKTVGAES